MQNITQYSDQELSLLFMNDEPLYRAACCAGSADELKELADEVFIYTPEQLTELEQDFSEGAFDV